MRKISRVAVAGCSAGAEITEKRIAPQSRFLVNPTSPHDDSAMIYQYQIGKAFADLPLNADWNAPAWAGAQELEIRHFRPESSSHRPKAFVKLMYSKAGIHGIYQVHDRYVRCVRSNYFDEVWKDSCVEFFAQPKPDRGYFNFEFNCGGAFLCSYIIDPERTAAGFKKFTKLPWEVARHIQVRASLPRVIESEISEPIVWTLQFLIPFALFEPFAGKLGKIAGQVWRGNFFKCAEEVSHPHWASWSPVDEFNFHLPRCFGEIRFADG